MPQNTQSGATLTGATVLRQPTALDERHPHWFSPASTDATAPLQGVTAVHDGAPHAVALQEYRRGMEPNSVCPICGIECRADDDTVVAGDHRMHAACTEAPASPKRRKVGAWAAMGARGQMAMGDVQRETPTWG